MGRPALGDVNMNLFLNMGDGVVLCVTVDINCREWDASFDHVQVRLVGLVESSCHVIWNCWGEAHNLIWGKSTTVLKGSAHYCGTES